MAGVYAVTAFLYQLYDVEAVFGFYYFRHFLGVVEVERHCGIFRHELPTSHESKFATAYAFRGFAVQDGECREVALAFVHFFGISAQARFDVFNLLAWD